MLLNWNGKPVGEMGTRGIKFSPFAIPVIIMAFIILCPKWVHCYMYSHGVSKFLMRTNRTPTFTLNLWKSIPVDYDELRNSIGKEVTCSVSKDVIIVIVMWCVCLCVSISTSSISQQASNQRHETSAVYSTWKVSYGGASSGVVTFMFLALNRQKQCKKRAEY